MSQLLLACIGGGKSYTELKRAINISDTALSKNLSHLQERGFLVKVSSGYLTTREGELIAQQSRLASEATLHKLARKLVILQKLVSPKEVLGFEVVRALSEPPLSRRKYLALAVASSIEIAYMNPDLVAKDELKLYEQGLNIIRKLLKENAPQKRVGVIVRFNLDEGYDFVLKSLKEELSTVDDPAKKKTLTDILNELSNPSKRDALIKEAVERFLIR